MSSAQEELIKKGFTDAEAITKRFARTFYFASRFLPKEKKYAAYSVYTICRISDESVDSSSGLSAEESLLKLGEGINAVYQNASLNNNPVLSAFRQTVNNYSIPEEYFVELIKGMYMDLEKNRYDNFDELYGYCYKVAGVVGLIMLKIFGYKNPEAEKYAVNLGIAMQLTNILRDIKEDYERGRIYLPLEDMQRFQVTEKEIAECKVNENFKALLRFQIDRARKYYTNAIPGIKMINDKGSRFVVCAMKDLYSGILKAIEKNGYDVFSKRAHLNSAEKLIATLKIILRAEYL
jgi:phytoene synthase